MRSPRPSTRAGVVLAAPATSGTGRPAAIACRTTSARVAVEPAIAPASGAVPTRPEPPGRPVRPGSAGSSSRRATPPATVTRIEPSRYRPSGMPAAAMASLTRTSRPGPAARAARRIAMSCRCTPSAITSQVTSARSSRAPTAPGSRWCRGRMPLNRWVACVAPASMAARVTSAVASVCPTATVTPARLAASISRVAPGSSGARVMIRRWPRAAACRRSKAAISGAIMCRRSWAPRRAGERNGPSRCRPATTPASARSASRAARASSSASGAVTRLASTVVLPRAQWNAAAFRASSAVPSVNDAPPPPWTCRSTNPGRTHCPRRSTAGGSGASPGPTASITGPARRIQPGLSTPPGVTTRPPASRSIRPE